LGCNAIKIEYHIRHFWRTDSLRIEYLMRDPTVAEAGADDFLKLKIATEVEGSIEWQRWKQQPKQLPASWTGSCQDLAAVTSDRREWPAPA